MSTKLLTIKFHEKITKLHRILRLRFYLKTIAEIASLKYIKESKETKVTECQRFLYEGD